MSNLIGKKILGNCMCNLIGLCPNCHIDLDKHKKFEVTRTATLHSMIIKLLYS